MLSTNPELELAYEYISQTKRHIFLTGKAGTGKTTFLHRIRQEIPKRMAVVAPTGVAAINAKGVTIHSLFQLPFGMLTPEIVERELPKRRFARKKIDLIRSLDLLVIDEISMVRADVLDAIDAVLQRYRDRGVPFGGVQLLMIGDLHQLPPVVRNDELYQMQQHYRTPYFFGCKALRQAPPIVIQLQHIYRQSDRTFIDLLNNVCNNALDPQTLALLNQRYQPNFTPEEDDGYITLSSHNRTSRQLNAEKLEQLEAKSYTFTADVAGSFPESMYPNTPELTFKVGAQVMFNKNDTASNLYYNGKIGVIVDILGEEIRVQCPGDETVIEVLPVTWENRKYELNADTKEVEDLIVGTYEQHPLQLAWAITIHKSQGLTFEKVIIDAQAAFAHGQVYVALSRCKTFEGIILRTPIETSSVRTDHVVRDYSQKAADSPPSQAQLLADKHHFQADTLRELFNFSKEEGAARWLLRALLEHEHAIQGDGVAVFKELQQQMIEKVFTIGNKFLPWLEIYFRDAVLPGEHPKLKERLAGAAQYFLPYLRAELLPALRSFSILTDNKKVRQQVNERLERLQLMMYTKECLFASLIAGFDPVEFARVRANATIDFKRDNATQPKQRFKVPEDLPNRELFLRLAKWRQAKAAELDVPVFQIAANKTLLEVVEVLPTTKKSLLRVRGFGTKRYEKHGHDVIDLVAVYLDEKGLTEHDLFPGLLSDTGAQPTSTKIKTQVVTLNLFQEGKTIDEIASERQLKYGTILSHFNYWIKEGKIPVTALVDQAIVDSVTPYFVDNVDVSLKDAFLHFKEQYTYDELRAVRNYLTWEKEQEEQ